jgi:radical SAM protein with 4Fe4S-binding SPASM domain
MNRFYYRPEWTCGRYSKPLHKAIAYNLLEGMTYLFEDDSAEVIAQILSCKKGHVIPFEMICTELNIHEESLTEFCEQLVDVGLLIPDILEESKLNEIRQKIRQDRIQYIQNKTVKERLPFDVDSVESQFKDLLYSVNVPFNVMFELTYNCNEQCIHCFNPGASRNDSEKSERTMKELQLSDYKRIIDELAEIGVVRITLTGGDPFVKKDIWAIIQYLYDKDFAVDIFTNGVYLSENDNVNKLARFYPRSVGISIYSGDAHTHELITRRKGSFEKSLSVVKSLTDLAIPVMIKCPITKVNVKSYYTVADIAGEFGGTIQYELSITNSVDGDFSITKNLRLDEKTMEIVLRDSRVPLYVGEEAPNYGQQYKDPSSNLCGAGHYSVNITPDGNVFPCNSLTIGLGNVNDETFSSIWYNSKELSKLKSITLADTEFCGKLDYCEYCNYCVGCSFTEYGSVLKPNTENCFVARVRMNLALKLQKGIDPIAGTSIKNELEKIEINFHAFSKEMKEDYRNTKTTGVLPSPNSKAWKQI